MADYTVLENVEDPDWKLTQEALEKRFDTGDMIESPNSEGVEIIDSLAEEPSWYDTLWGDRFYSDDDFYKAMVGWGEPGLGTTGDIGRDLWNQAMGLGEVLGYTSPATLLMGGGGDSIFRDMMFKGDVYDKIYSKGDYKDVDKDIEFWNKVIKAEKGLISKGEINKGDASFLNSLIAEEGLAGPFKEGNLSLENKSLLNEMISNQTEHIGKDPDEIIAGWRAAEIEAKDLPWYDPGKYDLATMGKTAINEMFTPSNVAADNPYKDVAKKIRIGGNIAPFVVSPITSGVRTVGSKVAPAITKAIANSRFGKTLSNLRPAGIFPSLVNKLPKTMQETVKQLLPATSGKGTFFPTRAGGTSFKPTTWNPLTWGRKVTNRNWMDANTLRNFGIAGTMQGGKYLLGDNEARAADILTNPQYDPVFGDRDPVIFDDVMQEKIQNFKPTPRGPGPWNEFRG